MTNYSQFEILCFLIVEICGMAADVGKCGHVRTIWLQLLSVWEAVQYLHALKGVGLLQLRRAHTHTTIYKYTNTNNNRRTSAHILKAK